MTQNGQNDVTVVIDVGTRYFRGGRAGEDKPVCELPTTTTTHSADKEGVTLTDSEPPCPMVRGCVRDWDSVERLLHSVYCNVHVTPDTRHSLLLTRHVHGPATDAERFVQLGLESLGASAVYLGVQPVLSLYANGGTDGVVLDCGEGVTQVVPIYQGYAVDHAIHRQDMAGIDVTTSLMTLLASRRPDTVHVDMDTTREIKEKLCYVSPTFDTEAETRERKVSRSYTLPGGEVISVGEERFRAPEVLFQPSLAGSECLGLPRLLHKSVSACPIDVRSLMLEKIIMAGCSTRTPGICRRLLKEVSALSPKCRVKVVASPGRQHSAWKGGSVLASLPSFHDLCVTKQDYEEHGQAIVRKKLLWT